MKCRLPRPALYREDGLVSICRLFFMLKTGAGTAAVGGPRMLIPSCPPTPAFANMSLEQREAILQYWSTSPIPLLRKVQTLFCCDC